MKLDLEKNINISTLLRETVYKDKKIFILIGIYGTVITILNLSLPLAIQNLIGSIIYSALIQPIIIVSIILIFVLSFSSALYLLQKYLIEIYHRASFARLSSKLLLSAIYANYQDFNKTNTSDLSARYFDIFNIQKASETLVTEGLFILLQIIVSCGLLSFYHPYLLLLSVICVGSIYITWRLSTKNAIKFAISNSDAKYAYFAWLNDVFKMNYFFKSEKNKRFALNKGSELINAYVKTRRQYWHIVFTQFVILSTVYLVLTMALFTGGSILVINGQLTLGQLVAAEIIFTSTLVGVAKLAYHFDAYYKLIASSKKICHVFNIEAEPTQDSIIHNHTASVNTDSIISINNVQYTNNYGMDYHFNLSFKKSSSNLIVVTDSDCESALIELIMRFSIPHVGLIEFNGTNYLDYDPQTLRDNICLVKSVNIFGCTLKEFLFFDMQDQIYTKSKSILEMLGIINIIDALPHGFNTKLIGNGYPLKESQIVLFKIARALISQPAVLLVNQEFGKLNKTLQAKIIEYITDETEITFIHFSNYLDSNCNYNKFVLLTPDHATEATNLNKLPKQ